ncbi:hypothetical protein NKH77_52875 [Streptomyces sp. M19]
MHDVTDTVEHAVERGGVEDVALDGRGAVGDGLAGTDEGAAAEARLDEAGREAGAEPCPDA